MSTPDHRESAQISRRMFHRSITAVAAGLAAGSLSRIASAGAVAKEQKPTRHYPAGKYVDIHVHIQQKCCERGELSPRMMLDWMDKHEIAQAVVLPLVSPESWTYPIPSGWVLEMTEPHRDRLIPFCDIDPRNPFFKKTKKLRKELKRYIDMGAKGLGEHKSAGPIDDPRRVELFQAAAELGLPILFHMDDIRCTDQKGLPRLEEVIKAVPNGVFLGHAPGWWSAIRDGSIDRLMDKYPNIYGDLSANSGYRAISRDIKFGREFVLRRADRLCFATDYLQRGQKIPQFALYEKLDLPADVQAKVFRDNARRILKL